MPMKNGTRGWEGEHDIVDQREQRQVAKSNMGDDMAMDSVVVVMCT